MTARIATRLAPARERASTEVAMKTRALFALTVLCLAALCGCGQVAREPDGNPPPTISDAVYLPGSLDTISITGEYFKLKSTLKGDVVVSLNGRNWTPAKKILESSPTRYVAVIPYGPAYPDVWVRVFGMNEEYSSVALIHVQRR
jgi:hypothetical protein